MRLPPNRASAPASRPSGACPRGPLRACPGARRAPLRRRRAVLRAPLLAAALLAPVAAILAAPAAAALPAPAAAPPRPIHAVAALLAWTAVAARGAAARAAAAATNTLTVLASIFYASGYEAAGAPRSGPAAPDPESLRRELLRLLNDERAAAGAPPLRLSPALDRTAQRHVDEVAARGSLRGEHRPEQAMEQRLREAGYDAHQWAENLMSGPANAARLVATWRRDDSDGTFRRVLDPAYTDLGVGVGRIAGAPLYSILFAVPESAAFARETAALRDRERVRAELSTLIDAERRRAGRQPLALDADLDVAAQRHADDMLARSYFAHRDPDGKTVRERARAAGFDWSAIGENIAEGQQSVKEVVESWMRSAGHRENILDRRYTRTGVGLALGRDPKTGEYRILWVQTFGLPR
jgi:uncharacterized protein YkwD